jgi:hypothetical protein
MIVIKSESSLGTLNSKERVICFSSGLPHLKNYVFFCSAEKVNFSLFKNNSNVQKKKKNQKANLGWGVAQVVGFYLERIA